MSQRDELHRQAEVVKHEKNTEGLNFGGGIITGRVLTVLIVSLIGAAIAMVIVVSIV